MTVREELERLERMTLSPFAKLSSETLGRQREERECDIRPPFQRDRDRIIHSKSFRRLEHKTQVFLAPEGDHYRTRLTHTLEVSQISRTIARSLRLNEDLTEAIALGHDLGHTPFGHAGEEVLNKTFPDGFRHAEQSLRVVDFLENDRKGLNLTFEVRDGILKHSKGEGDIPGDNLQYEDKPISLEAQIVRFADVIAYINHDLDDALRANIITMKAIPYKLIKTLGNTHSQRINNMVTDLIDRSLKGPEPKISMDKKMMESVYSLRGFLYKRVYYAQKVYSNSSKAVKILEDMHQFFTTNPHEFYLIWEKGMRGESLEREVCDFIAGMTDRYAISLYEKLFMPKPWQEVR